MLCVSGLTVATTAKLLLLPRTLAIILSSSNRRLSDLWIHV
jgi:hypothetical protein